MTQVITKQDLSPIIKSTSLLANLVVGIFFFMVGTSDASDLVFVYDEFVEGRGFF